MKDISSHYSFHSLFLQSHSQHFLQKWRIFDKRNFWQHTDTAPFRDCSFIVGSVWVTLSAYPLVIQVSDLFNDFHSPHVWVCGLNWDPSLVLFVWSKWNEKIQSTAIKKGKLIWLMNIMIIMRKDTFICWTYTWNVLIRGLISEQQEPNYSQHPFQSWY